jgi:hypothetical protein
MDKDDIRKQINPQSTKINTQSQLKNSGKEVIWFKQGVTKRCRLSWLTNSALVYEPKCGAEGGGGSQPMRTAVHMEPKLTLEI